MDKPTASTYQQLIDVFRSGLITEAELHWEIFRASAKHVSPPKSDNASRWELTHVSRIH